MRHERGKSGKIAFWYFFEKTLKIVNITHLHAFDEFSVLIFIFTPGQICDAVVSRLFFHIYHAPIYCMETVAEFWWKLARWGQNSFRKIVRKFSHELRRVHIASLGSQVFVKYLECLLPLYHKLCTISILLKIFSQTISEILTCVQWYGCFIYCLWVIWVE